eukprot:PhM_4_TR6618/c0_g1_i1/m.96201
MLVQLLLYFTVIVCALCVASFFGKIRTDFLCYVYMPLLLIPATYSYVHALWISGVPIVCACILLRNFLRDSDATNVKTDISFTVRTCKVCGRRIPGLDHHCGWVANDIGAGNLLLFRGFLAAHLILCGRFATHATVFLTSVIHDKKLLEARFFVAGSSVSLSSSWVHILKYLCQKYTLECVVSGVGVTLGFGLMLYATTHMLRERRR